MSPQAANLNAPATPSLARFGRFSWWKRYLGQRSERVAARFLRQHGYRILGQNLANRLGEIDLLAWDAKAQTLVIIEVRSISGTDPQIAALSVDQVKQKKVARAALAYLSARRVLGVNLRFDILALAWPNQRHKPTILHIKQAFTPPDQYQWFA